jgi:hypothetical protein
MNSDDSVMITVASRKFIARLHGVTSRNILHSRRCEDALITIRWRIGISPVCAVGWHTSFSEKSKSVQFRKDSPEVVAGFADDTL